MNHVTIIRKTITVENPNVPINWRVKKHRVPRKMKKALKKKGLLWQSWGNIKAIKRMINFKDKRITHE